MQDPCLRAVRGRAVACDAGAGPVDIRVNHCRKTSYMNWSGASKGNGPVLGRARGSVRPLHSRDTRRPDRGAPASLLDVKPFSVNRLRAWMGPVSCGH